MFVYHYIRRINIINISICTKNMSSSVSQHEQEWLIVSNNAPQSRLYVTFIINNLGFSLIRPTCKWNEHI